MSQSVKSIPGGNGGSVGGREGLSRNPKLAEWERSHIPDSEPEITGENAMVVIAVELRSIRKTLYSLTFKPQIVAKILDVD